VTSWLSSDWTKKDWQQADSFDDNVFTYSLVIYSKRSSKQGMADTQSETISLQYLAEH
jgi:hypothetical protein